MTNRQNEQPQDQPEPKKRQRKPRGRGKGEGSVFERKDKTSAGRRRLKPWVAQITVDGKRETVGYFKTEAEAIAARNRALRDLEQGTRVENSRQTLKEYLDYWLEHVHKPVLEITTYTSYRGALHNRVVPELGHIQVQKLTVRHIQMLYSKLLNEEKLGVGRVRYIHAILHTALDHAVKENLVARNVCDGANLPRLEKGERPVLTPEQAMQMLSDVQDSQLRMVLLLAVVAGLRRGELCALKWQDIDFTKRRLQIRSNLVRVTGRGLIEKSPKTVNSQRKISLPLFVIDALKKHQVSQQEARKLASESWQEHDFVFCQKNGTRIDPQLLDRWFKRLLKVASLPPGMRLHDLRHSAVTILLQMGVPPHVVQEIAGHSDVKTTLGVYGHVLPGQQESAMEKWDNVLRVGSEEQHTHKREQWSGYSTEAQALLEELLKRYGEDAVQLAMDVINLL